MKSFIHDWALVYSVAIIPICHCLGLGHETIVCAVCLTIFLRTYTDISFATIIKDTALHFPLPVPYLLHNTHWLHKILSWKVIVTEGPGLIMFIWISVSGCVSIKATTQIARFMGPTWGPPGADRSQVGPMLAPWTLLSGKTVMSSLYVLLWPAVVTIIQLVKDNV